MPIFEGACVQMCGPYAQDFCVCKGELGLFSEWQQLRVNPPKIIHGK